MKEAGVMKEAGATKEAMAAERDRGLKRGYDRV